MPDCYNLGYTVGKMGSELDTLKKEYNRVDYDIVELKLLVFCLSTVVIYRELTR